MYSPFSICISFKLKLMYYFILNKHKINLRFCCIFKFFERKQRCSKKNRLSITDGYLSGVTDKAWICMVYGRRTKTFEPVCVKTDIYPITRRNNIVLISLLFLPLICLPFLQSDENDLLLGLYFIPLKIFYNKYDRNLKRKNRQFYVIFMVYFMQPFLTLFNLNQTKPILT